MIKKIIIYGFGTFFGKIVVFLLVPIYTRYLNPADYGQYDVVYSTMQMLVSICYLEIWTGALRFLFDYKSEQDRNRVNKTILALFIPLSVVFICGAFGAQYWIQIVDVRAALLFGLSYALFNTLNGICRGIGENILYVLSGLMASLVSCAGGVGLIVGLHLGANTLLYASLAGYLMAVIFIEMRTGIMRRAFAEKIDFEMAKRILLFSFPLLINSIAFTFLNTYDKGLLGNVLGTQENGYYAVVSKYTTALSMLGSIYQLAWQEQAFSIAGSSARASIYGDNINGHMRFMGAAMPVAAILLTLCFPILAGEEYQEAASLIPLAIWSTYFSAFSGVIGSLFSAEKKTSVVLYSTILGAIINVIVINLCIERYGTEAINLALMLGFLAMCLMRMILINRYVKIRYDFRMIITVGAEYFVCTVLLWNAKQAVLLLTCVIFILIWLFLNRGMMGKIANKLAERRMVYK